MSTLFMSSSLFYNGDIYCDTPGCFKTVDGKVLSAYGWIKLLMLVC